MQEILKESRLQKRWQMVPRRTQQKYRDLAKNGDVIQLWEACNTARGLLRPPRAEPFNTLPHCTWTISHSTAQERPSQACVISACMWHSSVHEQQIKMQVILNNKMEGSVLILRKHFVYYYSNDSVDQSSSAMMVTQQHGSKPVLLSL